jgi:hypothetical protein
MNTSTTPQTMMIEEDDDEHDGPVTKEARAAAKPLLSDQNCPTIVGPVRVLLSWQPREKRR